MAIIRVDVEEKVVVSDEAHVGVDVQADAITDEMVNRVAHRFFELCGERKCVWRHNLEFTKMFVKDLLQTAEKMRPDNS